MGKEMVQSWEKEEKNERPHNEITERLDNFRTSFSFNQDSVRKFKRWKKRVSYLDKVGMGAGVIGVTLSVIANLIRASQPQIVFQALAIISLLPITVFILFTSISFIHSVAIWNSGLTSDTVAAYELKYAFEEYQEEEDFEAETVVHHLEQANKYLSAAQKHKLVAPNHANSMQEYISQISASKDAGTAIENTFPEFMKISAFAFSAPDNNQISELGKSIESDPTYTPNRREEWKEDVTSLLEFFVTGEIGPLLVATALAIISGFSFGPWKGATVLFGVITVYSLIQGRFNN